MIASRASVPQTWMIARSAAGAHEASNTYKLAEIRDVEITARRSVSSNF